MPGAGAARSEIARTLKAAYSGGLISEDTFARRLDVALAQGLIDRGGLIGDLGLRLRPRGRWAMARARLAAAAVSARSALAAPPSLLLALDWSGSPGELIIGRHPDCDLVLHDATVSRYHARLVYRDGAWVIQDLESRNGTVLNGHAVKRALLRPGDRLDLGELRLEVD